MKGEAVKAKEYLHQVEKLDSMIHNKQIEVEQWRYIAMGSGSFTEGERVQSSGNQQKMADAVARYIDIETQINADIDRYVDIKKQVIRTIEQLPAGEYDLLHKVYIGVVEDSCTKYLTLDEVAAMKGRSYTWATTLHGRALASVQKILDERGDAE